MIDPTTITNYRLTTAGLEEQLVFWICVAGKTAEVMKHSVEGFLNELRDAYGHKKSAFELIREVGSPELLRPILKKHGIGCHGLKSRSLCTVAAANMDLRTVTFEELIEYPGIAFKTADCFLLHSRPDEDRAGLDTHVLAELRDLGYPNVPKTTPTSRKVRERLTDIVRTLANKHKMTMAQYDLFVWNKRHRKVNNVKALVEA